jgi:arylsulfatase A-like enzyme
MYPSLCDACGIPIPDNCEGTSFLPLTENPDREWKSAAFNLYPRGKVMGYAVRTDRFRYMEWKDRETGEVRARELYDHEKDAQENVNAAEKEEYKQYIKELSTILNNGWGKALPPED